MASTGFISRMKWKLEQPPTHTDFSNPSDWLFLRRFLCLRSKEFLRVVVLFYEVKYGHDWEVRQDTNLLRRDYWSRDEDTSLTQARSGDEDTFPVQILKRRGRGHPSFYELSRVKFAFKNTTSVAAGCTPKLCPQLPRCIATTEVVFLFLSGILLVWLLCRSSKHCLTSPPPKKKDPTFSIVFSFKMATFYSFWNSCPSIGT